MNEKGNIELTDKTFKGTLKVVIIGMVEDQGLFIINDSRYITIPKKSLEAFTDIICTGNNSQVTFILLSDTVKEYQVMVQFKDNALITSIEGKEVKLSENLFESFKLTAFIKTFLLINQPDTSISILKNLSVNQSNLANMKEKAWQDDRKVVNITN